jgi:hypothetical protein
LPHPPLRRAQFRDRQNFWKIFKGNGDSPRAAFSIFLSVAMAA